MKVGEKTVVVIGDADGFGAAIFGAMDPIPHSGIRRLEDSFELSLERYGIRDQKACGKILHYVDDGGRYQVSLVRLQNFEKPVLVCALTEVLESIRREQLSESSTFVFPFLISSPKLRRDTEIHKSEDKTSSLYGVPLGPVTGISRALATKIQKPPPSLQINHEPLACVLQIARVMKLSAYILIGQEGQRQDLELIHEIGDMLAANSSLFFSSDKFSWNPAKTSKEGEEPWRALYG